MRRKWIVFVFLIICMLVGCSSSYERDTGEGKIVYITLEEMQEKMINKDNFIISFTQEKCRYCKEFYELFDEYRKNHNVIIYEVNLSKETREAKDNLEIIHEYFPTFSTTPGIYYAKDGKVDSSLTDNQDEMNKEILDKWVQDNQLDRKK
ncbi:MAG: thioredoxin [Clostridium paraputrificum]